MPARKHTEKRPEPKVPKRIVSSPGKLSRTKSLIKRIREINNEKARSSGLSTVRGSARFGELSKERKELLEALQKEFPEKNISEILVKAKLETPFEKKIRMRDVPQYSELRKIRRPRFSDAKREFLAKNGLTEKFYKRTRKIYVGLAQGREMNFTQRELFADEFARKANIPFSKAMNFINFAQRYSGMFRVRK